MIPEPNQYIIAVLRNGSKLDGNVVSWTNRTAVLQSQTSNIITVIQNTTVDVIYYQIVKTKQAYEEAKVKPLKTPDDIKELAELKQELTLIEKEELARKFSEHATTGTATLTNYGLPNIKSPPQHIRPEIPRPNKQFGEGLQGMFRKK